MKGLMKGANRKEIPPANKKFEVEFCTVAHRKNGEITKEAFLQSCRIDETDWPDVMKDFPYSKISELRACILSHPKI